MYKRVTHNITEEHFSHPAATEIKAAVEHNQHITAMFSPSATKFRRDTKYDLAKFFWRTRSYLVSLFDNAEDRAALENQIIADINTIGAQISPYYGEAVAMTFDQKMKAYVLSVVEVLGAVKAGQDPKMLRDQCIAKITDLAATLANLNPMAWPAAVVTDVFTKITDHWIAQGAARVKKDWPADWAANEAASRIFMNGHSSDTTGFADIFVDGIVRQFPARFVS